MPVPDIGVYDLGNDGVEAECGGVGVPRECEELPFSCLTLLCFGAGPATGSSSSLSLATCNGEPDAFSSLFILDVAT